MSSARLPERADLPLQELTAPRIVLRNNIQEIGHKFPRRKLASVHVGVNSFVVPGWHLEVQVPACQALRVSNNAQQLSEGH